MFISEHARKSGAIEASFKPVLLTGACTGGWPGIAYVTFRIELAIPGANHFLEPVIGFLIDMRGTDIWNFSNNGLWGHS